MESTRRSESSKVDKVFCRMSLGYGAGTHTGLKRLRSVVSGALGLTQILTLKVEIVKFQW